MLAKINEYRRKKLEELLITEAEARRIKASKTPANKQRDGSSVC